MLSIIIVNYHAAELIEQCIRSALQFESGETFEWIIVDNASSDNDKAYLQNRFSFIKWIDIGYNAGFARANNEGIRQSSGDTVLLLNPDTIIYDDAIQTCYNRLTSSNHIAAAAQLFNTDGTPQITANYFMKGGLNHLLPLPYLGKLLRSVALFFKAKQTSVPLATGEQAADWVNGAFLMVKKMAIKKAGLMDEDFFLFAEESEWCSRLGRLGTLCVYGDLKVVHLQGEIINQATDSTQKGYNFLMDKKGLQILVSNLLYIRKKWGFQWVVVHMIMLVIEIPVLLIGILLESAASFRNPLKDLPIMRKYLSNLFKLCRYLFPMLVKKPFFYKVI
jgi:GT2 family glycosyltransferase